MKIAAIGECMIEFAPNGQGAWQLGFAGDTFNTLWTLRGLLPSECVTDYISAFSDDDFSHQQLAFFAKHNIGVAQSPHFQQGAPGLYAITLHKGERSFTYWRNDSVARRLAEDADALDQSLTQCNLIYFSGISLAILSPAARQTFFKAITIARQAGSRIAFDPNFRGRLWHDLAEATSAVTTAVKLADIVLPTFDDERQLFGDSDPQKTIDRLRRLGVSECVIKNGQDPAFAYISGKIFDISPEKNVKVVDTTGAGDAFNGAYLAARLKNQDAIEATKFAHRAAALTIGVRGALTPLNMLKAL